MRSRRLSRVPLARTGGRSWQSCTASRRHGHQEGRGSFSSSFPALRPPLPGGLGEGCSGGRRLSAGRGGDGCAGGPDGTLLRLGLLCLRRGDRPVWERLSQGARSILVPCAWPDDAHDAVRVVGYWSRGLHRWRCRTRFMAGFRMLNGRLMLKAFLVQ